MIRRLKKITLQMIAGGNIASIIIMWLVGYSDRLNPADHPMLSTLGLGFPVLLIINFAFLIFWLIFKVRGAIIPLVGFVLCYVPVRKYAPLNIPEEAPDSCLKVMSYNVWLYAGWDAKGGCPILEYIEKEHPDILCLQEASAHELGQERLDSVMDKLYAYKDTCVKKDADCIAFYSKYPILSKERIEYPSKGNLSCAYKIKYKGDTIIVINNHLETTGLTPEERADFKEMVKGDMGTDTVKQTSKLLIAKLGESNKIRAVQAEAVNAYIEANAGKSIILCGDFNDGPISYTHRTIVQHLTDCFVSTGNGPSISYHKGGFYVRIDNIMCSEDWKPYHCYVDDKIKDSDHYPIICWLKKR